MEIFKLLGTIAIDNTDANHNISETTEKAKSAFSKIGSAAVAVGKTVATGLAAGATAIGALTKASIDAYADYEQLVGGIETLYGNAGQSMQEWVEEQAAAIRNRGFEPDFDALEARWLAFEAVEKQVLSNAANAYKTAGLSANEYMETITGFTAALNQTIDDTSVVAEYADMAVQDMSDNANKMGTDMSLIQTAYQGFAKQNYSMLDNLKLGYGGTAAEMHRLLVEAAKLDEEFAKTANFSIDSKGHLEAEFADIVEAIHIVQNEMGITGTTAKEASETIAGSVASMKAAWKNLLTGIADENADFEKLVEDFVDTVGVTAENIIPRIEVALNGAGKLVDKLVPIIIDKVPTIVSDFLPKILKSGVNIIESLLEGIVENQDQIADGAVQTIETLIDGIIDLLPEIIVTGTLLLGKLAVGLIEAIPDLIAKIPEIISAIVQGFTDNSGTFQDIGKRIVNGIWEGIKAWWSTVVGGLSNLVSGLSIGSNIGTSTKTSIKMGSHADGLDYVPYDGYIAELHKGEMVVPAAESKFLRSGALGIGNGEVIKVLESILYELKENNTTSTSIELNHREFARLVKAVN